MRTLSFSFSFASLDTTTPEKAKTLLAASTFTPVGSYQPLCSVLEEELGVIPDMTVSPMTERLSDREKKIGR
jgi:hypothetical protein